MIDAVLAAAARVLQPVVRACRTDHPDPGALRRAVVLAGFVPVFGLWMALRMVLLVLRRSIDVEAVLESDLAEDTSAAPGSRRDAPLRLACTLPDLIPMYLFLFGLWEPDLAAFMRRRLAPGDGFIDVGANVGAFTLLAARRVGPAGRVLAIEAAPWIAERLRENIQRNELNVRVAIVAASDGDGELRLFSGPAKNLGRTTTVASVARDATGVRSADELAPSAIVQARPIGAIATDEELAAARVIKIDVEGAEPAVLRGLAAVIPKLRGDCEIMVELSPHWWGRDSRSDGSDGDTRDNRDGMDHASAAPLSVLLRPFLDAGFRAYELPNVYWPWRYAWPRAITAPQQVRVDLDSIQRRVDLVLSRVDGATL